MNNVISNEIVNTRIGLIAILYIIICSCNSNKAIKRGMYTFHNSNIQSCISVDDLEILKITYFEKYPYQQVFLYPLFTSKTNECVGLWGCYTKLSPERPILLYENKVFLFSKTDHQINEKAVSRFKDLHGLDFDPFILEEIERHFLNGAIIYFVH